VEVRDILEERAKTHGDFTYHAAVSQDLLETMIDAPNWAEINYVQREGLQMIAHKLARILVGNPNEPDHWLDIAGYATLVADRVAHPE
jgi:hypothetical protein